VVRAEPELELTTVEPKRSSRAGAKSECRQGFFAGLPADDFLALFQAASDLGGGEEFNSFAQHKPLRSFYQSKLDVMQAARRRGE
jgi:hypothetical protein